MFDISAENCPNDSELISGRLSKSDNSSTWASASNFASSGVGCAITDCSGIESIPTVSDSSFISVGT